MAVELHDEIGQRLTALFAATDEMLDSVRGLARRMRPEVLDELGLAPALRNLCDRIEEGTGLVVRLIGARLEVAGAEAGGTDVRLQVAI